jgi:hypothetical protein
MRTLILLFLSLACFPALASAQTKKTIGEHEFVSTLREREGEIIAAHGFAAKLAAVRSLTHWVNRTADDLETAPPAKTRTLYMTVQAFSMYLEPIVAPDFSKERCDGAKDEILVLAGVDDDTPMGDIQGEARECLKILEAVCAAF